MPTTYEQLQQNQRCIYQAFAKIKKLTDSASAMGAYVNTKGIDADNERAVIELAKKYGFTRIEGVKGTDVSDGSYRFDNNAEIIAVITSNNTAKGLFDTFVKPGSPKDDPAGLLTAPACSSVYWHAVYGSSDNSYATVWQDDQNIFPNGPAGSAVSICFIKK